MIVKDDKTCNVERLRNTTGALLGQGSSGLLWSQTAGTKVAMEDAENVPETPQTIRRTSNKWTRYFTRGPLSKLNGSGPYLCQR